MAGGRPRKKEDTNLFYDSLNHRWRCWYYIKNSDTMKKERKYKSFKTEEGAKSFLSSLKFQQENFLYDIYNGIPLNLLIKSNIGKKAEIGLIGSNQLGRLYRTLKSIEREWPLATKNIDNITSDEIQEYMNSLKNYSNSYIKKVDELIRSAYKLAMNKGYIFRNPMVDVIKPKSNKEDKEIRAMTLEEQQLFTNYLLSIPNDLEPYKNVFLLQLFAGLRVGEALALKSTDIDLQKNIITIQRTLTRDEDSKVIIGNKTKTYSGKRRVPLSDFIRSSIIEQMKLAENHEDKLMFISKNNTLVNSNNINIRLKRILQTMGITGLSTHSLRHTFGTRCIEARHESSCSSKIIRT